MSKPAEQYIREQAVAGAVVNILLNGAIAWLVYRRFSAVPLAGSHGILGDLVVTGLLIPLLVAVIVSSLVRRDHAVGKVGRFDPSYARLIGRLPENSLGLGLVLALCVGIPAAVLFTGVLELLGVHQLLFIAFAVFKAGFAGLLAYGVTCTVVRRALLPRIPRPRHAG
jgi:hypothetical protein